MNRRQFLAASGVGVSVTGGAFAWRWFQSSSLPDGMTVDSWHYEADVLADSAAEDRGPLGPEEQFYTVLADREAAEQTLNTDVTGALTETEFTQSYLLVVQTGMQSELSLELDGISRTENGLDVSVSVTSPGNGGPDDLRVHSLLVRVTDAETGVPAEIGLDISGYV
jgi:hypothetical protein